MSKGQGGNPSRCLDILVNPEVDGGGLGDENLETFSIGALKKVLQRCSKQEIRETIHHFQMQLCIYTYIYIYVL